MPKYPTELVPEVLPLPEIVDQTVLNERGLHVIQGLTMGLAGQLVERSKEPHIGAFCPNDEPNRFHSIETIKKWQAKQRLSLPLVRGIGSDTLDLAGFGWMGPGKPNPEEGEPEIPGAITTFAIRLYESALKQGNSPYYTRAILDAHEAIQGTNDGVWLEAWKTNKNAIASYEDNGFITVAEMPGVLHGEPVDRVYMTLGELATY